MLMSAEMHNTSLPCGRSIGQSNPVMNNWCPKCGNTAIPASTSKSLGQFSPPNVPPLYAMVPKDTRKYRRFPEPQDFNIFFFPTPSPPSSITSRSITAPSKVWKHKLTCNNVVTTIQDCGSILHLTLMAPNNSYREEPFIMKALTRVV